MKIDPVEEVYYRFRLALEHLDTAKRRFNAEDWPGVVESTQLAVENLAKAIISHFHLPSWTHDPSLELLEISKNISPEIKLYINRLAEIVSDLAPEHGRTSYGIPSERLTPREIYNKSKAENALRKASNALKICIQVLSYLGYNLDKFKVNKVK